MFANVKEYANTPAQAGAIAVGKNSAPDRGQVAEALVALHHRIGMLRERQANLIDRLNPALRPDLPVFTPPREGIKVAQPKSQFVLTVEEASSQILDLVEQTENLLQALEL